MRANFVEVNEIPSRLVRKFLRVSNRLLNRFIKVPFIIIPYLQNNCDLNPGYTIVPVHNGFIIKCRNFVYKVGYGKFCSIESEYLLREKCVELYGNLDELLADLIHVDVGSWQYLQMPIYKDRLSERSVADAVKLYRELKFSSASYDKSILIRELHQLKYGLQIIERVCSEELYLIVQRHIDDFILNENYNVGFAHGDFHHGNIMIDQNGSAKLIDLDCMRVKSIQEFDALNFIVEHIMSKSGIHWTLSIANIIRNCASKEIILLAEMFEIQSLRSLSLLYFVDRIGQEQIKFGIKYPKSFTDNVLDAFVFASKAKSFLPKTSNN